jgi:hypothetical protein
MALHPLQEKNYLSRWRVSACRISRRVPDGAASLTYSNPPRIPAQYVELNRYGLLYVARDIALVRQAEGLEEELHFLGLLQVLQRLVITSERFYAARGYRGNLLVRASVHGVHGRIMRFIGPGPIGEESLEDFRCITDTVNAERMVGVHQLRERRVDLITDILSEITWAFWQSNQEHPTAQLRALVERG